MKKFTINALAIAAGALSVGGALAGSIPTPAAPVVYAAEGLALSPSTTLTTPSIVYSMGVGRPQGNGFTVILTSAAGTTLGACVPLVPSNANMGITLKRFGVENGLSTCAYDVQLVPGPSAVGDTLTWTNQTFVAHGLANKGNSISVSINLKDPGETAQVDNAAPISRTVATSVQAINVYAAASDVATVADVNAAGGPLTGFVANATVPADTATTAAANLTFDHNSVNAKDATGAANYVFSGTTQLTLTGDTSGAATNGFCIDLDADTARCEAGEVFTVVATAATLANATGGFGAQGTQVLRNVSFAANGTTQLGTSRTFAVTGLVTPTLANTVPNALVDTAGKNATAWVWSANASQLMTPYFTTSSRFLSRVFFLNTGALPVGYSATCFSETGNTITYGAGKTGTLSAGGQTAVDLKNVCSFANTGLTRGAVLFTINAPISTVKGSYQQVDPVSLNNAIVPLSRPYNQANTTE